MKRGELTKKILEHVADHPGTESRDIVEAMVGPENTTTAAISYLVSQGRLVRSDVPGHGGYYLPGQAAEAEIERLAAHDRIRTIAALKKYKGNVKRALAALDMTRHTFDELVRTDEEVKKVLTDLRAIYGTGAARRPVVPPGGMSRGLNAETVSLIAGLQEICDRAKLIWDHLELCQTRCRNAADVRRLREENETMRNNGRCQNMTNIQLAGDCDPPMERKEYCFSARLRAADACVEAKKLVQYTETILRDYDVISEGPGDD